MADTITDNRTVIANADSIGGGGSEAWVGTSSPSLDTDIFIEGAGSIGEQVTSSRRMIMNDQGGTADWSNNVVYIWILCGIVGLLDTKANGGMRIRVAGASTADFKEWNVGGNDFWPLGIAGGWVQFVVDLEKTADAAGGAWSTTQANTAIQHIGYSAITTSVMTRTVDNTWIDAIWRLPDATAGILIQGKSGGSTAWNWADVPTQLGQAAGSAIVGAAGSIVLNTSVQWFIDDATDHAFDSTNDIILLDAQTTMPADQYHFTILGAATGTADFTVGIKTGTLNAATGAQGMIFVNTDTNLRYTWDTDIANIDSSNFYGCTFLGGGTFAIGSAANEWISDTFVDCDTLTVSGAVLFQRASIIAPFIAAADNANPSIITTDMTNIRFCSIESGLFGGTQPDGHAIELTGTLDATQESRGNKFGIFQNPSPATFNTETGVNGTTDVITVDVAIEWPGSGNSPNWFDGDSFFYNDKGGTETIGLTDGVQYWANLLSSTTLSVHTSRADALIDASRVNLTASTTGNGEVHEIGAENATIFNDQGGAVTISVTELGDGPGIRNGIGASTIVSNDVSVTVTVKDEAGAAVNLAQVAIYEGSDPASPGAELLNTDTNASGIASTTFNFVAEQAIIVRIRKTSTGTTRYVPVAATGTITSSGFNLTRTIVVDNIVEA